MLRNFHQFQSFTQSFLMSSPLGAIPSICNQRSLVKESLYARLGYINSAERGKILSHKDKMRSSLLAFFVCISVASSLFFQVSFKNLLNTIDIRIKIVLLVPFFFERSILQAFRETCFYTILLFFELETSFLATCLFLNFL